MRRMTAVVAMVARCQVDSIHVLTKDSAATIPQLCQCSSCLTWHCLFGCRPLSSFDDQLSMAVLTASWWMLLIAEL